MPNTLGLLNFDWDAPVSDEDRDRLFDKVISVIRKWRLEVPAALLLESSAPLGHIAGQSLVAFSPFVAPWLPDGIQGVQRLQKILEQPRHMQLLIDKIYEIEAEKQP